ncbi:MAG: NUDIX domain-containing protein [Hyphomicrobiales bacterium]|nr:NUDIX domain-containing protein [Hyphomicrobiales bacterium]
MTSDPTVSLRTRLVSGAIRRIGLVTRGMTLGVRAIVIDGQDRVFLVRHTYVKGWYLPGGGVERGEDAVTSLARELDEEGDIALAGEPELFGLYAQGARDHVAVYIVRAFTQRAPKAPDREIAEAGFFPLDALPAGATRATRERLDEMLKRAPKGRRW